MTKLHLPPLTETEFAVVLAALRKFAEKPTVTDHFSALGHAQRKRSINSRWIDALATRINTNSEVTPT